MRTRTLLWLTLATALVVVAAGATVWQQRRAVMVEPPQPLVPGLTDQLNEVTSFKIAQDEHAVEIVRTDTGWTLGDHDGYPALIEPVRQFLLQFADLKRLERKGSDEALLGPLGFGTLALSPPTTVEIATDDGPLIKMEIGATTPDGLGRYVRILDDDSVWVIEGTIHADPTVPAWAQTDLLRLGSQFLKSITITQAGEHAFTVTKAGSGLDANYTIDPMPEGREVGSPSQFAKLFSSVALLTFVDVRRLATEQSSDSSPDAVLSYTTTAGSSFTINVWNEQDSFGERITWIAFEFENKQQERSALEGWAYRLTPFAADAFEMGVDDLTFEQAYELPDPSPAPSPDPSPDP